MITIRKLIWDTWNVAHIARHHVNTDEVEEVCHGMPVIFRGQKKNRLILVGITEDNRILAVILESKSHQTYYPITAYPANNEDISLYKRLRGGEDDEKTN